LAIWIRTGRGLLDAIDMFMHDRGFTLIEVFTALALLAASALSIAQLIVATTRSVQAARLQTAAITLAVSRMEELRSLAWEFDASGNAVSDGTTGLAWEQPTRGGSGLTVSPAGALDENTPGFVDFLDAGGHWISAGPAAPATAVFVRRWSIEAPADGSPDSLVLQVVVRPIVEDVPAGGRRPAIGRSEGRLLTVRTRIAR
jgi:prepilin-type N-terminal cleavage/methylation domain-containing protein